MRAGQEKNIEGGGDASPWTGAQTIPSTLVRTLGTNVEGGGQETNPGGSRDGGVHPGMRGQGTHN